MWHTHGGGTPQPPLPTLLTSNRYKFFGGVPENRTFYFFILQKHQSKQSLFEPQNLLPRQPFIYIYIEIDISPQPKTRIETAEHQNIIVQTPIESTAITTITMRNTTSTMQVERYGQSHLIPPNFLFAKHQTNFSICSNDFVLTRSLSHQSGLSEKDAAELCTNLESISAEVSVAPRPPQPQTSDDNNLSRTLSMQSGFSESDADELCSSLESIATSPELEKQRRREARRQRCVHGLVDQAGMTNEGAEELVGGWEAVFA